MMRTLVLATLVAAALGAAAPTVAADHICRPLEPPWHCAHQPDPVAHACARLGISCDVDLLLP